VAVTAPSAADSYGSISHPEWLTVDWSRRLRWMIVAGRRVNVLDAGDPSGDPIVFVHGHNVCWQHWLEQLGAFRHTHRVITLDLPGFGNSEDLGGEVSIEAYADVVASVCAQLGVTSATVVGNSMGGAVSAELALRHPSDRYMGLPAALIRHRIGVAVSRGMFSVGGPSDGVVRTLALRPRGRVAGLGLFNGRPTARPDLIHPVLVHELLSAAGHRAAGPAAVALATHDLRGRMQAISAPTLIIWGDRDNLVPLRCAHEFERSIPGARLLVYGQTGHNAQIERPARLNTDLAEFLSADAP
jgi:pimeloyl-ACP methyl ester carboxylesterase